MDRRNFLRISALGAMSAACSASGLSKVFAQSGNTPAKIEDGEIRHLMGVGPNVTVWKWLMDK